MNKTVNINLAGIFFHIDEDAYLKLQRYLEAIKRSFTDSQGRSEIITDIEARIAELFNERVQNNKEVIRIKEVDEIISIMGQPEDYLVDDEIFEDEPQPSYKRKTSSTKKLFRDTDNSYVGGVSSGLAHYFGIDVVWIRLAWILLIISAGVGVLLYILLWVLVPEASTTAEKIMMTGEPVTISNIEKKIKDGFENVSDVAKNVTDTVGAAAKNVSDSVSSAAKNVDFKKQSGKIKSSSKTFFDTLGEVMLFFLKIFAKFIGMILIITGAITLIVLIIALFSIGVVDFIHIPGIDLVDVVNAGDTPIGLVSLFTLFAVGIPFFFLFYLGLKILINNLKSIGSIAKFTLLGLWLISVIGLVVIGIKQASEHANYERTATKHELHITANDTIRIDMAENDLYGVTRFKNNAFNIMNNENGEKSIYRSDIKIIVKSTSDSLAKMNIQRSAFGRTYDNAIERAKAIDYNYTFSENKLLLDSFLTTPAENKLRDQEILIILYLPEGSVAYFGDNTRSFLKYKTYNGNIVSPSYINHYIKITDGGVTCLDCPDEESYKVNIDIHDDESHVKLDKNGLEINDEDVNIKINNKGISGEDESVEVNIDSDGINIKSKDD